MDVATTPAIQAIGADSVLTLGFAFFRDGGEVTWDVAELWMSAKANDPNYIMAVRAQVPAPSMDDEDRNEWDRILNRRHPYNARSEEHTSELLSLMRNSYAVFCLKKKKHTHNNYT